MSCHGGSCHGGSCHGGSSHGSSSHGGHAMVGNVPNPAAGRYSVYSSGDEIDLDRDRQ